MKLGQILSLETRSGTPQTAGRFTMIPRSQALRLSFPYGGFVWNRPVTLEVDDGTHREEIAITDVTRIAQLALLAAAALFILVGWQAGRR